MPEPALSTRVRRPAGRSRSRRGNASGSVLGGIAVLVVALAAVRLRDVRPPWEGASPDPSVGRPAGASPAPGGGPGAPVLPPDPRQVEEHKRRLLEEMDAKAHKILDTFVALVQDLHRDAGVRTASADVTLTDDGRRGEYRLTFDASRPLEEQVRVEVRSEEPGVHPDARNLVRRYGLIALRGGIHKVLRPIPPTPLLVTYGEQDRMPIVTAEAFRGQPQSSYRTNELGWVRARGDVVGTKAVRSEFAWRDTGGRIHLIRASDDDGKAKTEYGYDHARGYALLNRVQLDQEGRIVVTELRWEHVGD